MKWCTLILILIPVQLCSSSSHYFSTHENLTKKVILFFSDHFDTRCAIVLQSDGQSWKENRETLQITKYLIKIGSSFLTIPFHLYSEYAQHYHYRRSCAKMIVIILGWQRDAKVKFSKLSHKTWMADYKWLIILSQNMTAKEYLKHANTPFNSEIMIARLQNDQVVLEEAYRVADYNPLRVLKYGVLDSNQTFVAMSSQYLYARRKDMEGFPIRAATRDDYPISRLARMKYTGQFVIEGYFGTVYYELANLLNYTTVYVEAVENATGFRVKGVWNGLLGMLQRDEIDFAVGPISFVRELTSVAGALRPILRTNYQIFFQLQGTIISWNDIFKPFAKHVWLSVVVWVLIATYTLNRFFYIECNYGRENFKYQKEYTKINSFLTFLQALCQQGSHFVPESNSCRLIYITGYFASTILLTAYSAVLISNLTTQAPRRPFDSLETLLEHGSSYELMAITNSTDYSYFSSANDTLRQGIFKKLMKHIPEDTLPTDKEEGIDEVCKNKKRALFITFGVTQLTADMASNEKGCPILHFRTPLDVIFLTIARKKFFPYSSLIDYRLQNMAEFGILSRLQREHWPLAHFHNEVHFREVTLEQVVQIHFLWISGMIMSLTFLYFERAFHDKVYRHNCGILCRRKMKRKIDQFVKYHSEEIQMGQNCAFWLIAVIIIILIIYAF